LTLLYCVNYSCIQKSWIQQFHFIALYGYFLLFYFQGLDLAEIIVESDKRGITFDKLLTVLMMYKEAGLFDPISSSVEVTEFTVSALESLCSSLCPYIGSFVSSKVMVEISVRWFAGLKSHD